MGRCFRITLLFSFVFFVFVDLPPVVDGGGLWLYLLNPFVDNKVSGVTNVASLGAWRRGLRSYLVLLLFLLFDLDCLGGYVFHFRVEGLTYVCTNIEELTIS